MQKTVTSPDKREMSVQIRLPSGIAQSVECQKFLFLNFSVCYTNQRAAVQETVTSLVTPDVVGSSPTPLWDSSVGRTPLCLFLDFSARFFKKNNVCIAELQLLQVVTVRGELLFFMAVRAGSSPPTVLNSILSRFIFIKICEE